MLKAPGVLRYPLSVLCFCAAACRPASPPPTAASPDAPSEAERLAHRFIIADGHIDLPHRLHRDLDEAGNLTEDITGRTEEGDFDFVRAKAGGLDAPFMSIYVPAKHQAEAGASKAVADELIDLVTRIADQAPDQLTVVTSPDEIEAAHAAGRVALPLGIENGSALEDDLDNVRYFHDRGVRYITLTHAKDNRICDSSYADTRTWKGLSPFGREVVREMNRVGVMVDVSHVTDDTIRQVLELTDVPVIASHSSCRHFTPGFERNLSDELITAIADEGGVVLVNFGSMFIDQAARAHFDTRREAVRAFMDEQGVEWEHESTESFLDRYDREHPPVLADVTDVADHIDHIVELVGVDHVGFGSDFDGVGPTLPHGLEDVSKYPNLIRELLKRGYAEEDIEKICASNLFRVWRAVKARAALTEGS